MTGYRLKAMFTTRKNTYFAENNFRWELGG